MQQMQRHGQPSPMSICCFCAPEDTQLLIEWENQLLPLQQAGWLSYWSDQSIPAGVIRSKDVTIHLAQAECIVLLLSTHFFANDDCMVLMQQTLVRAREGDIRLVPLLLRPVLWQVSALGSLACLPSNGKAVTLWTSSDEGFATCAKELCEVLNIPSSHVLSPTIHRGHRTIPRDRKRDRLLQRLSLMYRDLLTHSLQGTAWLELGLTEEPAAVESPTTLLLRLPNRPERTLDPDTSIVQAYEEADHELLVLGEPGSGKSTLLYHLARYLLERAQSDPVLPIPILLPLSLWAKKRLPLETWIVEQCMQIYGLQARFWQQWLQNEQLLPLFDGLDEIGEDVRSACITAINTYHREHLLPLVVSSRRSEYALSTKRERLALQRAVIIQPLTFAQTDAFLLQGGQVLEAVRSELKDNTGLRALVTTPLWLNILILTYQGKAERDMPPPGRPVKDLQHEILTAYVENRIASKGDIKRYPFEQTVQWLTFLARQMQTHHQTIFSLDQLRTDWLPQKQQLFYHRSIGLLLSLFFMPSFMLTFVPLFGVTLGVALGVTCWLAVGVMLSRKRFQILLTEKLAWSWKQFRHYLPQRLGLGLFCGAISGQQRNFLTGLLIGCITVVGSGLLGGVSFEELRSDTPQPLYHQGIYDSVKNGIIVTLITGLFFGLWGWCVEMAAHGSDDAVIFGFSTGLYGLFLGVMFGGLLGGLQHMLLRFWLWRSGVFPWGGKSFLEDARSRILLQRIGSSYSFIHGRLLDYLADLGERPSLEADVAPAKVTLSHRRVRSKRKKKRPNVR